MRQRVLPAWLDDCFPGERPVAAERRLACRSCARGWLADLERRARPVLEPMIAGVPVVLPVQNQETAALWAAKTMLSLQAVRDPEQLTSPSMRHLYEEQRPPNGFRIAAALRPREGRWPYRVTATELCIGHLVIQTNLAPHAREYGDASLEIWPARVALRWPPPRGIVRAA